MLTLVLLLAIPLSVWIAWPMPRFILNKLKQRQVERNRRST
jgi:hypothetical protein